MTKLADAYDALAEAAASLAIEIRADAAPAPTGDDLPALPFTDTPAGRSEQGGCPVHGLPWVVRPAGTSKATGQPYKAFWHCNEQNDDGSYCRQKPTAEWVKAHQIR